LDLEFFLEDVGNLNVYSVSHRIKAFQRAMEKARRLNVKVGDLEDLAGLRVVVATGNEVDVLARLLYRQQDSEDLKVEFDRRISKEDGYRARHLGLLCRGSYSRSMFEGRVEVQILTVFQHAFNFVSRAWVYKSGRHYSPTWQSDFINVSKRLAVIDEAVTSLQDHVTEATAKQSDDDSLTPFSYQHIVRSVFQEKVDIDEAVDECRFLTDLGINTNGSLKAFFADPRIHSLRERIEAMRSDQDMEFEVAALSWPLRSFWSMLGSRLQYMEERLSAKELSNKK
jgi:ppGpp synthetase/RelA/SpoT-type nucleotidyltranferase